MTVQERLTAAVDERFVVEVWERQAFDAAALEPLGLKVVYRGEPSDAGGPDYQEALFALNDGGLVEGDVEFHVLASDWYRHGHAGDERYNGVVLHVVWIDDVALTVRADGRGVTTLALAQWVTIEHEVEGGAPATLAPPPCRAGLIRLDLDSLALMIDRLGQQRFDERTEWFRAQCSAQDADQVIYAALLEGLGYASNRESFRRLADTATYGWVMSVSRFDRAEALLTAAGLNTERAVEVPSIMPSSSWRLARLRPANHPATRLRGIAALLERLQPSLAEALVGAVEQAARPAELRKLLRVDADGMATIGQGRADELAVSVVLPFVASREGMEDRTRGLFLRYPSPPETRWTRAMLALCAEAGHLLPVKTAVRHQGLHLLHTKYCRYERRECCPLCGDAGCR